MLTVMTVIIGLPGLALAQQTGLFPTAPVRRQRPPCDQEDPVYKIYKQQYFGYHPTCWRRFPDGWGCPSPEAPDRAKSLKEHPFGKSPEQGEDMLGSDDDMRGQPAGVATPRPNVPPQTDPFEEGPANPPGGNPPGLRPRQPAPPANTGSPFDNVPDPGTAAPAPPRTNAPGAASLGGSNRVLGSRSQRSQATSNDDNQPIADEAPLLAMPNLNAASGANGTETLDPLDVSTLPANSDPNATATPPSNPPRRSLIGSFFNNLGMNWTRR